MSRGYDYWQAHQADYPFHAQEDANDKKVPFRDKDQFTMEARYGQFLRCPWPEIGLVLWGFKSEEALQLFLADYGLTDERGKGEGM